MEPRRTRAVRCCRSRSSERLSSSVAPLREACDLESISSVIVKACVGTHIGCWISVPGRLQRYALAADVLSAAKAQSTCGQCLCTFMTPSAAINLACPWLWC